MPPIPVLFSNLEISLCAFISKNLVSLLLKFQISKFRFNCCLKYCNEPKFNRRILVVLTIGKTRGTEILEIEV